MNTSADHKPFFSICIPTRNRRKILEQTLNAIFSQTFKDYEIIISDNCSDDDTPEYCRKLMRLKKVKYYRNKTDVGMGMNTYLAGKKGTGKFIFFLADDDLLVPECLEKYYKILSDKKKNIGLCRAASYGFLSQRDRVFNTYIPGGKDVLLKSGNYPELLKYNATFISGWAVINSPELVIGKGYQDTFIEAAYSVFGKYNFYFIAEPLIGAMVHSNLGYTFYRIVSPWFELDALVKKYVKNKAKQDEALRVVKQLMTTDCHNIKIYTGISNFMRHFRWYFAEPVPKQGKLKYFIKSILLIITPDFFLVFTRKIIFTVLLYKNAMKRKLYKTNFQYA